MRQLVIHAKSHITEPAEATYSDVHLGSRDAWARLRCMDKASIWASEPAKGEAP